MKINLGGEKIEIPVRNLSMIGQFLGLMFSRRERARALLFNHRGAIHSFFVFFPFIILWLDKENTVVEYKIVRPFQLYVNSNKKYNKFIEIPINSQYHPIVKLLVGICRRKI